MKTKLIVLFGAIASLSGALSQTSRAAQEGGKAIITTFEEYCNQRNDGKGVVDSGKGIVEINLYEEQEEEDYLWPRPFYMFPTFQPNTLIIPPHHFTFPISEGNGNEKEKRKDFKLTYCKTPVTYNQPPKVPEPNGALLAILGIITLLTKRNKQK